MQNKAYPNRNTRCYNSAADNHTDIVLVKTNGIFLEYEAIMQMRPYSRLKILPLTNVLAAPASFSSPSTLISQGKGQEAKKLLLPTHRTDAFMNMLKCSEYIIYK